MRFTILLDPDIDGEGYTVTVPALPGCVSEGRTIDEALANAREAVACHIEGVLAVGDEVPREDPSLIPLVIEVELETRTPALSG